MKRPLRSVVLVAAQFTLLAGLGSTAPWPELGFVRSAVVLVALLLVGWAYASLGALSFSVFPEPGPSARFTCRGPYRRVRHPMYLAVLLTALALGSARPFALHTILALLLVPVIVAKVQVEERALAVAFPDRAERVRHVALLIPGFW